MDEWIEKDYEELSYLKQYKIDRQERQKWIIKELNEHSINEDYYKLIWMDYIDLLNIDYHDINKELIQIDKWIDRLNDNIKKFKEEA